MIRAFSVLLIAALVCSACRPTERTDERVNELGKVRSGSLDVVLLSPARTLRVGKDTVTIEFRSASDGRLMDVGTVKATAMMSMAGMSPMFGPVDVQPTNTQGRYVATSELSMAGEWRVSVEWNGSAGSGSASFSSMVQ